MDKIAELKAKLAQAIKLGEYWTERRKGQVGNCISDQESETEAWRKVKALDFQIRELQK